MRIICGAVVVAALFTLATILAPKETAEERHKKADENRLSKRLAERFSPEELAELRDIFGKKTGLVYELLAGFSPKAAAHIFAAITSLCDKEGLGVFEKPHNKCALEFVTYLYREWYRFYKHVPEEDLDENEVTTWVTSVYSNVCRTNDLPLGLGR